MPGCCGGGEAATAAPTRDPSGDSTPGLDEAAPVATLPPAVRVGAKDARLAGSSVEAAALLLLPFGEATPALPPATSPPRASSGDVIMRTEAGSVLPRRSKLF